MIENGVERGNMKQLMVVLAAALMTGSMAGCSAAPGDVPGDMVARYRMETMKTEIIVKTRPNGDFHAEVSGRPIALVGHGGKAFRLFRENGHWVGVPIDSLVAACESEAKRRTAFGYGPKPPGDGPYQASAAGTETVAGHAGAVWTFSDKNGGKARLVVSDDAKLAPVGAALRQMLRLNSLCALDPFNTNLTRQMAPIEAKGTVLRSLYDKMPPGFFFTPLELVSLDKTKAPDTDFTVPAKILSDQEVRQKFAGTF